MMKIFAFIKKSPFLGILFFNIPVKKWLNIESFVIKSEQFFFFFKNFNNAIDNFCTDIFSVNIFFAHLWIVVRSFGDFKNQVRIYRWRDNVRSGKNRFGAIRTKTQCHARHPNNICFFLHTSRIGHHAARLRNHIHYFVMMSKGRSIGKIFAIFFDQIIDILAKSIAINSGFGRIQSKKTHRISFLYEFFDSEINSLKTFFYLTIFAPMNGNKNHFFSFHIRINRKSIRFWYFF